MNKGRYINKLHLVRQHRENWYLKTFYEFMDKVRKEDGANPAKVEERWNKNKAVQK